MRLHPGHELLDSKLQSAIHRHGSPWPAAPPTTPAAASAPEHPRPNRGPKPAGITPHSSSIGSDVELPKSNITPAPSLSLAPGESRPATGSLKAEERRQKRPRLGYARVTWSINHPSPLSS